MKIGNEQILGIQVYEWVKHNTELEPYYFHFATEGKRGYVNADLLKRSGFKAHVPDIFIAKANKYYHGLWIEIKDKGKKPTAGQLYFMQLMQKSDYYATWFDNFESIVQCIQAFYLD